MFNYFDTYSLLILGTLLFSGHPENYYPYALFFEILPNQKGLKTYHVLEVGKNEYSGLRQLILR
jgi:hypothetical protein